MLIEYLLIASGATTGALLRWKATVFASKYNFAPHTTVAINTAGSFILGVTAQLSHGSIISSKAALLVGTGFCGSFTTLSTFSVDVVKCVEDGLLGKAVVLVAATNILGISVTQIQMQCTL